MKFVIILVVAVSGILAAPQMQLETTPIPILDMNVRNDNSGAFDASFRSGNGISQQSSGQLKDLGGTDGPVVVQRGAFSFVGDDGVTYTVNWEADELGFRASGAHLPTPPPIPAEILKSLAENNVQRPF